MPSLKLPSAKKFARLQIASVLTVVEPLNRSLLAQDRAAQKEGSPLTSAYNSDKQGFALLLLHVCWCMLLLHAIGAAVAALIDGVISTLGF